MRMGMCMYPVVARVVGVPERRDDFEQSEERTELSLRCGFRE